MLSHEQLVALRYSLEGQIEAQKRRQEALSQALDAVIGQGRDLQAKHALCLELLALSEQSEQSEQTPAEPAGVQQ